MDPLTREEELKSEKVALGRGEAAPKRRREELESEEAQTQDDLQQQQQQRKRMRRRRNRSSNIRKPEEEGEGAERIHHYHRYQMASDGEEEEESSRFADLQSYSRILSLRAQNNLLLRENSMNLARQIEHSRMQEVHSGTVRMRRVPSAP